MQEKLHYLLDRTQEFNTAHAQLLDDLTLSIKNNTNNVPIHII
jgi:hypothetical protein